MASFLTHMVIGQEHLKYFREENEIEFLKGNIDPDYFYISKNLDKAKLHYGKPYNPKLTQKQKTSVVETIRNSIIHANYILGANDKFEIYDQKSAKEKQIEHKFTVYTDELEQIKDVCIKVFEDFGKKLNKKETKSPEKDAPIK